MKTLDFCKNEIIEIFQSIDGKLHIGDQTHIGLNVACRFNTVQEAARALNIIVTKLELREWKFGSYWKRALGLCWQQKLNLDGVAMEFNICIELARCGEKSCALNLKLAPS